MGDNKANNKRAREDSDESPDPKRLLLDILDEVDSSDRNPVTQDLATVMKSFEDEISLLPPASTSDSGQLKPDLGYLLEASDDELGIPPTTSDAENEKEENIDILNSPPDSSVFGQNWGFEDEIPTYGPIDFGIPEENGIEDSVVFEGLFDYPDAFSGTSVFQIFVAAGISPCAVVKMRGFFRAHLLDLFIGLCKNEKESEIGKIILSPPGI